MTESRLKEIEAILTAKLFPHGGWDEARELIEAVREGLRVIEREKPRFKTNSTQLVYLGRFGREDLWFDPIGDSVRSYWQDGGYSYHSRDLLCGFPVRPDCAIAEALRRVSDPQPTPAPGGEKV